MNTLCTLHELPTHSPKLIIMQWFLSSSLLHSLCAVPSLSHVHDISFIDKITLDLVHKPNAKGGIFNCVCDWNIQTFTHKWTKFPFPCSRTCIKAEALYLVPKTQLNQRSIYINSSSQKFNPCLTWLNLLIVEALWPSGQGFKGFYIMSCLGIKFLTTQFLAD